MKNEKRCCDYCDNLIALGEGDFICYECGDKAIFPVANYTPTENYLKCGGKKFSK